MSSVQRALKIFIFTFSSLLLQQPAQAGDTPSLEMGTLRMSEVTAGRLLLPAGTSGHYQPLPTLHTDVHMRVSGAVASVTVKQRFHNPGKYWVEGIYVFPLPEEAAVHRLRMHVGERVIEGIVKEKQKAKKIYQAAKKAGQRASLVEQERPNMFTTSVANIGPDQQIVVELQYVEALHYTDGRFQLRFPTVVGPRYIPGTPINENAQPSGTGWAFDTNVVPDASRITPPVLHPKAGKINPVSVQVEIDPGFPLARLASSYQQMQFNQRPDGVYVGAFTEPQFADRDVELVWIPELGHTPRAAVFVEHRTEDDYALLLAIPPKLDPAEIKPLPRELILVIDTSGSMAGQSIVQATAAAHYALDQLTSADRFNLIQFNSRTQALFTQTQAATQSAISTAHNYLNRLSAGGGTEMLPALQRALREDTIRDAEQSADNKRVRQVVFITDGAVGNETQLFEVIRNQLGNSRLFTVGIGSAPNSYFMRRAAEFGRGTFSYIGKVDEVQGKMSALFKKIRFPVLTDLKVAWPATGNVESWPQRLPDLYLGEPVILTARMTGVDGVATLSGRLGEQLWRLQLPLRTSVTSSGISTLWARSKIKGLMDRQLGGQSSEETRARVVALGTEFNLVTRYTSLVAVDVTPVRPQDEALHSNALPSNLPHGWSYDHVFGALPRTASPAPWHLLMGSLLLLLALALFLYWRHVNNYLSWRPA